MEYEALKNVWKNSLNWFCCSGIMCPADGTWGIAERFWLCDDPELKKRVFDTFNSFTEKDGWSVIESRRADCNFQTALLFLLSGKIDRENRYRATAENLLEFLYCRSGLLNRGGSDGAAPGMDGVWNWSHTEWRMKLWFDDNAWALMIQLRIAELYPELAERFGIRDWAEKLAERLCTGFRRTFLAGLSEDLSDPEKQWFGRPLLPHWGSLVCTALALAVKAGLDRDGQYQTMIREYHGYLEQNLNSGTLNVSEQAYALTGAAVAADCNAGYMALALAFADRILAKADPGTGVVPAEHYEAPKGAHLADTIYTMNWILLGFHLLVHRLPDSPEYGKYRDYFDRLLNLFAEIQDQGPEKQFHGCWRGMFDLRTGTWGGGNSYEGGAGSIYSGWTNAPVALVFTAELLGITVI